MNLAAKKVIIISWFFYPFSSTHLKEIELRARILMPQIRSIKKLCVPHKEKKGDGSFHLRLCLLSSDICSHCRFRRDNEILQTSQIYQEHHRNHRRTW